MMFCRENVMPEPRTEQHEYRKRKLAIAAKGVQSPREELELMVFKLSCGVANKRTIQRFIAALDRYMDRSN